MNKERALEIKSLVLVYGSLVVLSLFADWFSHRDPLWAWRTSHLKSLSFIGIGIIFVVFQISATILMSRIFRWASELQKLLSQVLTPISYIQILWLSLLSGFVEEWFFRGILMHHFGLMVSSILFGLAHFLPAQLIWRWSVISLFSGLILGALYYYSESLLLVAIVHSSINLILILRLNHTNVESPSLA